MRRERVKDLIDANRMAGNYILGPNRGLRFPSGQLRWADVALTARSGASFAGEMALIHDQKEPHRSQKGRVCLLPSNECAAEDRSRCI